MSELLVTDRERALITGLIRVLDQADAELAKHKTIDGEPFAHIRQIAFEGLDRPTDAQLKAYREGKFTR